MYCLSAHHATRSESKASCDRILLECGCARISNENFIRARAMVAAAIQIDSQHPDLMSTQEKINKLEEAGATVELS